MIPRSALFKLMVSLICLGVAAPAGPASAQAADAASGAPPATSYRFSYTPAYQFDTDLDIGGKFDVARHFLRFDVTHIVDRHWVVGLGLSFDYERWNFSGIDGLAGADLWDEIVRPGISIPIIYSTADQWRLMVIPSLEFSGATGAEAGESLSYGTVVSAMHAVGSGLMIGVGAGVFDRLDEWEVFPFLAIDWKINDRFTLSNPFQAGPAGPAGLELVYSPSQRWELGAGGAYRSYRFRLDDSSVVADGIGEVDFWAAFMRLGWRFGGGYRLDVNGGVLLDGRIRVDDADGNHLGDTDTDTAPFVGLTLRGQF